MKKKLQKRTTKTKATAGKLKSVSPKAALASSVELVDQLAASQTGTYLKPANRPGALWVARANGHQLTNTGLLQLARARNAAGSDEVNDLYTTLPHDVLAKAVAQLPDITK